MFGWQGAEEQYLDGLREILQDGIDSEDRTGTGTLSVFGMQKRYPLTNGFPLLTTKKIHFKSVVHELLWFLSGSTNIKYLQENGVRIWNEWADEKGDLGPVYGRQWRSFNGKVDQITKVIESIKTNPYSRRHIVSAWNPLEVDQMALPPCHTLFQFYVREDKLSCQLYQRSADMFLGVPFNIASYALLTHMVAKECNLGVKDFVHTIGDAHIYINHLEQVYEQTSRTPRKLPDLLLAPQVDRVLDYEYRHVQLHNYDPQPSIKAEIAV